MGRATEFIDFINTESSKPGHSLHWHCLYNYSHITKNDKLMKVRKEYRKNINKEKNNEDKRLQKARQWW